MDSVSIALSALACPLGMAGMGGAAWLGGKLRSSRSDDKGERQPQATT